MIKGEYSIDVLVAEQQLRTEASQINASKAYVSMKREEIEDKYLHVIQELQLHL